MILGGGGGKKKKKKKNTIKKSKRKVAYFLNLKNPSVLLLSLGFSCGSEGRTDLSKRSFCEMFNVPYKQEAEFGFIVGMDKVKAKQFM